MAPRCSSAFYYNVLIYLRNAIILLLNSIKVKTHNPGRPRKRVKELAADQGYDSKELRAALRKVLQLT